MATPVIMPKFGMAQETGQIIQWFRQEGEAVTQGEPLLEVMTDKVSMEVEAPASGLLRGVSAAPDDVVPVTEIIAYIVRPGEAFTAPSRPARVLMPAPPQPIAKEAGPAPVTPVAQRLAAEHGVDLTRIAGSGPQGRITRKDVEAYLAASETDGRPKAERAAAEGKVRASPAARRVAREAGVPLEPIEGSGPHGRIQAADVEAFVSRPAMAAPPPRRGQVIPLRGVRKIIAERMAASARTAPHITLTLHADVTEAEALRAEANRRRSPERSEGGRAARTGSAEVSFTALLVRIVAWALAQHPWLNAALREDGIHLLPEINIGVAVALEAEGGGLIVPVVRDADRKGLAQIAAEVNDLADRARAGRLTPDEVTGGTFTLSNLGMFGIETFTAIINPPETAILAVGMIIRQPVALNDDRVVVRPMIALTLSADHRVVDGALAARFLADVKAALEQPSLLLV